ncbi:MAG: Gfo/Idh/MocA family oxidoreductase [Planctomycetes bacterium]|nr:Gfo/Idh/MocA family oxidoreductase [Planctomycetota bacterium]
MNPNAPEPRRPIGRATRLGLVGAGFIADVHLQVLRAVAGVEVVALCDAVRSRAERLARRHGVPRVCGDVAELLALGTVDAVHVLVPPAAHAAVVRQCLERSVHVLVEKPMVLRAAEVAELAALARAHGCVLAVNHNQAFHPAIALLQRHLAGNRLGRLEHLALQHHVPLRQLQTGDVGHFMFQTEANILWEQGVHLFSMVWALLGPCRRVQAVLGPRRPLPNGVAFAVDWHLQLECERGTAGIRMAFGRPWLETTVQAIGSDGSAWLDLQRGACWLRRKTRWLDFLDHGRNLAAGAWHLAGRSIAAVAGYGLSLFGLGFPDDPFLRGMRGSLRGFHAAVRGERELPPAASAEAARDVLQLCEDAARAAGVALAPPLPPAPLPAPGPARPGEVVVLGGTGFLGRRCVQRLRAAGRPLTLVVRRPQLLPPELRDGSVRVFAGDAADPAVLAAAFVGADAVLHLATAAGDDAGAVEAAMAAAVRAAGAAALAARVRRFVYTSSTAALWLGAGGRIDGSTGPDPRPAGRAAYARGKIAAERELAALAAQGLPLVVVRPAIVVGHDGVPEHSGVGLWVRDNHCVGWGRGAHPLPFVLADDCAQALVAALDAAAAAGRAYNLAGDVRLSAREWVAELAHRTGRDHHFHPTSLWWMWLQEFAKYLVKVAARRPRQWPAYRDLASRSFRTELDCSDARRDLGFAPEADRARFLQRVFDPQR